MKYSVITLFIVLRAKKKITVREIYQTAKEAGFDTIDVDSMPLQLGATREEIKDALRAVGLKAGCYISFLPLPRCEKETAQAGLELLKEELRFCKELGSANYMFVPQGYQEDLQKYGKDRVAEALKEALTSAVALAGELGLTVGIEDAPDISFPMCRQKELEELMTAVPGLKLFYDTGNMIPVDEDPLEFYDALKESVAHVHVKDMEYQDAAAENRGDLCIDGRYIDGTRHGKGIVPLPTLLERFRENKYQGLLALEYVPSEEAVRSGKYREEMAESLRMMKEMEAKALIDYP